MKHLRLTRTSVLLLGYLLYLYLITSWHTLRWPVVAEDTDLWFHLTGGRYMITHHALAPDSFFSFLSPPRPWVDYAWLFQVIAYALHSAFQYDGLVVLRTVVYLLFMSILLLFLFTRRSPDVSRLYLVTLLVVYWCLFLPPCLLIRPRLLTYLWIALFLWVCEDHPRRILWLLPVGILWCNMHGITYPVMLLISGAYLLERLMHRGPHGTETDRARLTSCVHAILVMATIFATPYGWKLLALPSRSAAYAAQYIAELKPITLEQLTTFTVIGLLPTSQSLFNLILGATGIALIVSVLRKQLRISHLMLIAGGVIGLLCRGWRAVFECALFALPLLRACAPRRTPPHPGPVRRAGPIALGIILVVFPLLWLQSTFGNAPKYPVSRQRLPHGVAAFLNRMDAGGSVLNFLNSGGYLEWQLYPKYKIFADMDVPFFFTDEDVFTGKQMFHDGAVLQKVLAQYDPAFITVPIVLDGFRDLIRAFPDYRAVFFDDAEVLYVNQRRYPAIAAAYGLQAIDPYRLSAQGPASMLGRPDRAVFMHEARRLLAIDPECRLTNQLVSMVYGDEAAYDRALLHAEAIIRAYPESPTGYGLRGDALRGLAAVKDAVASYRQALRKAEPAGRPEAYYQLGVAYLGLGQHRQAYAAFQRAVNLFAPDVRPEELSTLAKAALELGKTREANTLATFALIKLPARAAPQQGDDPTTRRVNAPEASR